FPPIGGGGVPRALKMAKYLGEFGWNVHVLTVDPAYHATLDPSLLEQIPKDVHIHRAREFSLFPRRGASQAKASFSPAPAKSTVSAAPVQPSKSASTSADKLVAPVSSS
ncbi:hypothetical protein MXD63_42430, partial [Frankia sp. Cpl3]|nr:hypothetical protein [Frankia sp. Cpl3]